MLVEFVEKKKEETFNEGSTFTFVVPFNSWCSRVPYLAVSWK